MIPACPLWYDAPFTKDRRMNELPEWATLKVEAIDRNGNLHTVAIKQLDDKTIEVATNYLCHAILEAEGYDASPMNLPMRAADKRAGLDVSFTDADYSLAKRASELGNPFYARMLEETP
jgi:hypothetical protein